MLIQWHGNHPDMYVLAQANGETTVRERATNDATETKNKDQTEKWKGRTERSLVSCPDTILLIFQ